MTFKKKPAGKHSLKMRRLIHGVATNDAWYTTDLSLEGKRYVCPVYRKWKDMLKRCYSEKYLQKYPTYSGTTVCKEWLTFSNFALWMEQQDYSDKHLDKDLLKEGNKVYSPDLCVFVSNELNNLIRKNKGGKKVGVHKTPSGKFLSKLNNHGVHEHIGVFDNEEDAHVAYCIRKKQVLEELALKEQEPLRTALLCLTI